MSAFVGHSGAGKSTIINLLPRFYDPQEGKIIIDDQNIKEVSLNSLRKNLSLVSQDVILFDDTIKNNIAYAKEMHQLRKLKELVNLLLQMNLLKSYLWDTILLWVRMG